MVLPAAPEFTCPLANQIINEGDDLVLTCQVRGHPAPTVSWEGPPGLPRLRADHRVRMMEVEGGTACLEIADVRGEENGEYTCTAINYAGAVSTRAQVSVRCESNLFTPNNLTPFFPLQTA